MRTILNAFFVLIATVIIAAMVIGAVIGLAKLWAGGAAADRERLHAPTPERVSEPLEPSLEMEVVRAAGRAGLPAHLALELAQSESGITSTVRRERNGSCSVGVMQINMECGRVGRMTEREEIEIGVGMVERWRQLTGGDWPSAVYAYRHGHLPGRQQ